MGRNILIGSFLAALVAAIYIFCTRDQTALRKQIENGKTNQPRIILEDFTIYRYANNRLISTLSGRMGAFVEPNIIDVSGDIRGIRHDSEKKEYLLAQSAEGHLKSFGVIQMMNGADLDYATFQKDVRVGWDTTTVKTEDAKYTADRDVLESDIPVVIETPTAHFNGENGFEYDVEKGDMTVQGPIKGVIAGDVVKKKP